jgi:hypothetical protein
MSFDLYFCWRNRERINFADVKAWAEGIECVTPKDAQLWYSNPKTGVYFSFDFEAQAPTSPEDGPDIPGGYFDSGLSFNLNYIRPSYFGLEAMPIVEKLASRFGLRVANPQSDLEGPESAIVAESKALTESWLNDNQRAILAMIEQPNSSRPLSMPVAASLYLWRYGIAKEDLERACGEEVFVPGLVPVHRKGETKAGVATVYTESLPTIVPQCQWVFIVRRKRTFFRSKQGHDVAAISFETFREMLVGYLKPFHWQDLSVEIIGPELAEEAGKIIRAIDRTLPRSEFEVIGADSFVDINLPSTPD